MRSLDQFLRTKHQTTDVELEDALRRVPGFLGVVDRTKISAVSMDPGDSLIVNIDGGYKHGGTHWVALVKASEAPLYYYFCSYGGNPVTEATLRARSEGLGLVFSDVKYQTTDESNCGQRAGRVIADLAKGRRSGRELETFLNIAGYWSKNKKTNRRARS